MKAKFDAGEESGCKADPQQVAIDMRNTRTEENKRMFSRDEWLSRNQVQSYFSRLAVLKRKQTNTSSSRQATIDDLEYVVHEEDWLQQVDEVYEKLSVQHPIYYDAYNLCDLRHKNKLDSFNMEMLKSICNHFEISFKSKDRKYILIEKLENMIAECS